jgi:hypothetical protein
LLLSCGGAAAGLPVLGDSWVYTTTFQALDDPAAKPQRSTWRFEARYLNTLGKPIFVMYDEGRAQGDENLHVGMGSDTCLFDIVKGHAVTGDLPCGEPLPVGKTWHVAPDSMTEEWLAVARTEPVRVGAATYVATVIQADRTVSVPGYPVKSTRSTYWHVPEMFGMVRVMREWFDEGGKVTARETDELQRFTPAAGKR